MSAEDVIKQAREAVLEDAESKRLDELQAAFPDSDEELIRNRFLCRGHGGLLVGPTGAGKSSLNMQGAICFAAGHPFMGLEPTRPLHIWIIQAENDEGDLAEMRDGVLSGLGNEIPEEALLEAQRRIRVFTQDSVCGDAFGDWLDAELGNAEVIPDLLLVDPVFAYFGGDASSQREVSPWLRNVINPVIHRHRVGLLFVHHTNKPQPANGGAIWNSGDYAYLGAGSAEWCNWARAVLALRQTPIPGTYELRAAKRGRRLEWYDDDGEPTFIRYVAHAKERGRIFWTERDRAEVEAELASLNPSGNGRPRGPHPADLTEDVAGLFDQNAAPRSVGMFIAEIQQRFGIGQNKARDALRFAEKAGVVIRSREGHQEVISRGSRKPFSVNPVNHQVEADDA